MVGRTGGWALALAVGWVGCDGEEPGPKDGGGHDTDTVPPVDLSCADLDAGASAPFTVTDTTLGAGAELDGSCGGAGEERTIAFRAPAAGRYLFDTHLSAIDATVYALAGCGGEELGCDADGGVEFSAHLVVELAADEGILLVVDGEAGGGPFVLTGTAVSDAEASCGDGYDDDADVLVDCLDPDCAADPGCAPECPDAAAEAPPSSVEGDTTGAPDALQPSCGTGPSSDVSIRFEAPSPGRYAFALSTASTRYDSVLALVDDCGGAELACADVAGLGGEALAVDLGAGEAVLAVVDGYAGDYGPYELAVFAPLPAEVDCVDGVDEDVDGLADCADPDCAGDPGCVEDCGNGVDDDGDLLSDCLDPDCELDAACAEDCGDGVDQDLDGLVDCEDPGCDFDAACPEDCTNHDDDDGDGLVDCDDGFCAALPECGGECPDLVLAAAGAVNGTTLGADDAIAPTCAGPGSPEVTVSFTPTETATYVFDTQGSSYDTILAILSDCGGDELACNDDGPGWLGPSQVALPISSGDTVIAVIDGLAGGGGDFVLNVAQAPAEESVCDDGIDEDFDGLLDCADPGCAGLDGCASCPEDTLAGILPITESGTTSGTSAFSGSCSYGTSPDHSYAFTAPATDTYTFSTAGSSYDTVLYVLESCAGPEITCNDDSGGSTSEVQVALTAGQTVIVVVDGYGGSAGDYDLTVSN